MLSCTDCSGLIFLSPDWKVNVTGSFLWPAGSVLPEQFFTMTQVLLYIALAFNSLKSECSIVKAGSSFWEDRLFHQQKFQRHQLDTLSVLYLCSIKCKALKIGQLSIPPQLECGLKNHFLLENKIINVEGVHLGLPVLSCLIFQLA